MEVHAQRALEDAGFKFVQVEPRLPELRNHRPDLIAWAGNERGELVPWAVVEVKRGPRKSPELSLSQLARYRDLLGTVDHYVVNDDAWFRADDGLLSLKSVDAPQAPPFGPFGELADVSLITSLITAQLHRASPADRADAAVTTASETLRAVHSHGIELAPGEFAPVARDSMFEASRRLVETVTAREPRASSHSPSPVLARAMATLGREKLTGIVLDPFAGVGSLLWAVADEAADRSLDLSLHGREMTDSARDLAASVGLASPIPVSFEPTVDFFAPIPHADLIVSVPPFGIRFQPTHGRPYELLDGSPARDGDFVVVDMVLRALNPGGRAVLLIPSSFTYRASGERYRQYLAEHFRVATLIGLDTALAPSTNVSTVLLVIDRAEPGETFVAQLAGDWESQLAPAGAALEAALQHVESWAARP